MSVMSDSQILIRWLQIFISMAYPVAIVIFAGLAWVDWHRWVNHRISLDKAEERLDNEVQEFIE